MADPRPRRPAPACRMTDVAIMVVGIVIGVGIFKTALSRCSAPAT